MSSPVEFVFSQSSSPKLPAIGENRNLVSQPLSKEPRQSSSVVEKDKASVSPQKSGDEVDASEEKKLIKLISRAFINALQRNNEIKYWAHLCEVLELAKPYSSILKTKQIFHYAERACIEIQGREELEFVNESLQSVFADVITNLQSSGKAIEKKTKFPSGPTEDLPITPRMRTMVPKGVRIPRDHTISFGSMYVLDKQVDSDTSSLQRPRELSLKDLNMSLAEVIREISARDSVLGVSLGMAILAVDIDFPQKRVPTPPETPRRSTSVSSLPVAVDEGQKHALADQTAKREKVFIPRTGREIVEVFIKGNFLGELKFAYLNIAPSRQYDPYNLIEVPKDKINPEHFIISSHSILHISPTNPSESQPLSEWYTEATIFQALRNLSFFKNFLLRKMFQRWRELKKHNFFVNIKSEIEQSLLHNVPTFGSALLRISSLLIDLSKVTFLPFEENYCYTIEEFEDITFKTSDKGRMYLNKFFSYCQMIVDKTEENCFEYLRYCEALVKNHCHNYRESLAVAKEKHNIRQQNLRLAREEVTKLGNFVNLVDHIIFQNLLTVAQTNICKFVDVTLPGPRPGRDGLFKAYVVFDENNQLSLAPSPKQLSHSLSSGLDIVLGFVCSLSHAMDLGEEAKSFIINASKANLTLENPAKNVSIGADIQVESELIEHEVEFSPLEEVTSEQNSDNSASEMALNFLVSPEHLMKRDVCKSSQDQPLDSDMQDMRTEVEISEDIDNFNTSLASTRQLRQVSAGPLCSKRVQENVLVIEGKKVDQSGTSLSPLTKEKLQKTLCNDEKIRDALKYQEEFVAESIEEVQEFCNNHSWLTEIHKFISTWDVSQVEYWKNQPTSNIEQQLHQIQTWTEQVSYVIKTFSTANGLLYVDCHAIQNVIIPKLNNIFKQMVKMVAFQVLFLSKEVIGEMERLSESLKDQRVEIKGFADFTTQLEWVKSKVPALKEKVEHIKNLFEVIRSCYRQLSAEEEVTEEKVWDLWESFLFGLQEASDFVQLQRPLMVERIAEVITSLEEEAIGIGKRATSGRFLDPNENPTSIITAMRQLRDRYLKIRNKLKDMSTWKEAITGFSYNLSRVLSVYDSIEKRQELWRYYEVSTNTIKDWLNSPFKKVNIKRAIERVSEWMAAGNNLKTQINANDAVLTSWMSQLEEFVQDLPLLLQLSSDALKPRHWRALFINIGQEFDSSMLFTTAALLSFNLGRYKDLITTICAGANKEHALELQLNHLSKAWRERDFKLAKYIPLMRSRFRHGKAGKKDGQSKKKRSKMPLDQPPKRVAKPRTPAYIPDSYTLIGIGELKCILEDNLITLKSMVVSPHVADLKPSVEYWITCLHEIQGILDIWHDCQRKWLYLSNAFSEPNIVNEFPNHLNNFTQIDTKYREFIYVIAKDSKVVSVIQKNRGEKGWREMQGETMRALLLDLIQEEEELINVVEGYMQQARNAFPRLYFLSDNTLLDLLAWSRNPKDLLPLVKMCFPGIQSLQFALPRDSTIQLTTALDAALNAHLMEATAMEGIYGENVTLVRPIPATPRPQKWLANLEQNMRDTLIKELGDCVSYILSEGMNKITGLVERIANQEDSFKEESSTQVSSAQELCWLRFPSQCILTAHAVAWVRQVNQTLASGRLLGLSSIRSDVLSSIDDLASAIRKNTEWPSDSPLHMRLQVILAALFTQAVNHRDVVNGLIDDRISSVHSFEWQSEIRPDMEINEEISSSYDGSQATNSVISVKRSYKAGRCTVEQLGSSSAYGYEYLGPSSRLVTTPLTKRCFLTLNMALQVFKCGTPHGPDGTGKTETIGDLSKILGRHLVMFDCTPSLTSPMLVRYLSGMVSAGSWVCFENIDSVNKGVLSVFGQHLEKIKGCMKALKRDFNSQYSVRGLSSKENNPINSRRRRSSVTSLTPLYGEKSAWPKPEIEQELKHHRRRLSVTETDDIPESSYYQILDKPTSKSSTPAEHSLGMTFQDSNGCVRYKDTIPLKFSMPLLGTIVFNNRLMAASEMYGCFMTMSSYYNSNAHIPENLKALLRPVSMIVPDVLPVLEVSMTCCGFTEAKPLAKKIHTFFKMISDQVSHQAQYDFSLRSMRSVISLSSKQLRQDLKKKAIANVSDGEEAPARSPFIENFERRQTEENSIVHGIFNLFGNKLITSDREVFSSTIDAIFVHSVLMSVSAEGDSVLQDELKEYFQANGLQLRPEMISKALQLYKGIQSNGKVIVVGSAGSGKTTLYQALTGAISNLHTRLSPNILHRKTPKTTNVSTETADNEDSSKLWPKLDVMVVYPKSMSNHELFGQWDGSTKLWRDGLISKYLRDTNMSVNTKNELQYLTSEEKQRVFRGMSDLSRVEKWLVFNGGMDDLWMGNMNTVLDNTRALSLGNGGTITVPDTVNILFETSDLSNASPSLVTRCSIVHCPDTLIGWKSLFRSWIKTAHSKWEISSRGLGIISCLMDHVVETTLEFLQKNCQSVLTTDYGNKTPPASPSMGIYEVQTLLRYLTALFDRHILREDEDHHVQVLQHRGSISIAGSTGSRHNSGITSSDSEKVIATFAFAFVWSFGGHLHDRYKRLFDEHARQLLLSGPYPATIPEEGLVYDYCLDFLKGTLIKWEDRQGAQIKTLASSFTVVPELDRYFFLMDLMIFAHQPVVLVGDTGSGKSALIQNLISPRYSYQRIFMSPGLSSKLFQETIESKVNQIKRREDLRQVGSHHNISDNGPVSHPKSKSLLFFLDNLNCANADETCVQPPLELLRQILAEGYLYDKKSHQCNPLQNVQFIATAVPPSATGVGSGVTSHVLSPRLTRLMTVLSLFPVSSDTLTVIYSGVFLAWLQEFPAYALTHHSLLATAMASAAVQLFDKLRQELRPSPLNPHFIFTQHDLARVAQSMSLFSTSSRSRPRPRMRRRGGGVGSNRALSIYSSKEDMFNVASGHNAELLGKESSKIYQESSTMNIEPKQTIIKTPAVLSPLIRSLFRLWCHENTRAYYDRLFDEDQRFWFASLLNEQVEEFFCKGDPTFDMELLLDQSDSVRILADHSRESFGVAPGSNAPPPSAKDKTTPSQMEKDNEKQTEKGESDDEGDEDDDDGEDDDDNDDNDTENNEDQQDEEDNEDSADDNKGQIDEETENEESEEKLTVQDEDAESDHSSSTSGTSNVDSQADKIECTFSSMAPPSKVTFGDIKEVDDNEYKGPLITFGQLTQPGENLTDIVFNKHFSGSLTGSALDCAVRGYVECTNDVLECGLNNCLASYNSRASESSSLRKINMVVFRQALQHATRISRALATQGGHALLLSCLGYGRRTLARLACHAAGYKLIELQAAHFQSKEEQRQQIKAASYVAGLQGKQVVLFVPEDQTDDSLQDICTLMAEGTCPALYTSNEMGIISSQLLPGGQRGARRTEHQDIAQERFFRRVKSNLHVIVCLRYVPISTTQSPSASQLYRFPLLLTRCCCVDTYIPWPHEALTSIAEKLIDQFDPVFSYIPWDKRDRETQVGSMCSIMAHVHLSARTMVQRVYGNKGLKLYSPDDYLDFVDLFKKLCERLCSKEKATVTRLEQGIQRIEEANSTIAKMNDELSELSPQATECHINIKQSQHNIETSQKEYQEQKESCKKQELELEKIKAPVDKLKKEAQEEFGKVSPLFDAALKAINSLDVHDVEEIRSYRVPPFLVELVAKSICLLFRKNQTWQESKKLFNRDNFFKDLEFYNIKGMTDLMFRKLKEFCDNEHFKPEIVKDGSAAAASLCMWVRAVYDYGVVYRELKPKRKQIQDAEKGLEEAKTKLGEMRVHCTTIKQELEEKIETYKENVKLTKTVEKKIQVIESRKFRAANLVNSLSEYHESWKNTLDVAQQHLATSPGDALIAAACVCYFGPLNQRAREELFLDWLKVCDGTSRDKSSKPNSLALMMLRNPEFPGNRGSNIDQNAKEEEQEAKAQRTHIANIASNQVAVREEISLASILTEKDELTEWIKEGLPNDDQAVQNALIMRTCSDDRTICWPLLIDPHGQAEKWVRALMEAKPKTAIENLERSTSHELMRRSSPSRVSSTLEYQDLNTQDDDDYAFNRDSDGDDVMLPELKDDEPSVHDSDSPMIALTDQTGASTFTSMTDKTVRERLAQEMGIQIDSPDHLTEHAPTPNLDVEEGQIMVIPADDQQLVSKIRAAAISGVVVLVTHMERRRWNKKLWLLLSRQILVNNSTDSKKIVIGKSAVEYHPSFRLFLSTNIPLYMLGEGVVPLPLSKTCVIDMSLSQEGATNCLLTETLTLERPEYEGQKRSLERDLTLHEQQMINAKAFVLDKVLELNQPLLKDTTMLANVNKSKDVIITAGQRYQESLAMRKQMQAKRDDFLPVARHGAMLYTIICQMHRVRPAYYHMPLETYLKLFRETVAERKRNKKNLGSPAARAAELVSALSKMIYTRMSWGLFLGDNLVFPFLVSVEKLFSENQITEEEWRLFIYRQPLPEHLLPTVTDQDKPPWVTQQAWRIIDHLEILPPFKDLRRSLIEYPEEWREYFLLPPVLLANTPGDISFLTIFQKALLWRIFREDQMFQVCQDFVLYVMGATMVHPVEYDIHQVHMLTNNSTPIVFMLPSHQALSDGTSITMRDPNDDILDLARTHGKATSVMTVCLGEDASMEHALNAVQRGMDSGLWVVIRNAHLALDWSQEFLDTLQVITSTPQIVEEHDKETEWNDDYESRTTTQSRNQTLVHPEFRLFLTVRVDCGRPLPAILIQRGLKLACESKSSFRSTMKQVLQVEACSINSWSSHWKESIFKSNNVKSVVPRYAMYALAYFHSLMVCRRRYGSFAFKCPYQWSYPDVRWACDILRYLTRACVDHITNASENENLLHITLGDILASITYSGHVTDMNDWSAVGSMAMSVCSSKLLQSLDASLEDMSVEDHLKEFPESPSLDQLGLVESSATQYSFQLSRAMSVALETSMDLSPQRFNFDKATNKMHETFDVISGCLTTIKKPEQQNTTSDLAAFFTRELDYYKDFLCSISKELQLMIKAIEGSVAYTPHLHSLMETIYQGCVPHHWYSRCPGPLTLGSWLESLSCNVISVQKYTTSLPNVIRLGAFVHQQSFFSCVMRDFCKINSKAPQSLEFNMEVMTPSFKPDSPAEHGVYLSDLTINNAAWDTEQRYLTDVTGLSAVNQLPIVSLTLVESTQTLNSSDNNNLIVYKCPLITVGQVTNHSQSLVTGLPVLSAIGYEELFKRKVYLSTSVENF